ncbi:DUF4244 domain-containing protein [Arcanobacterium hippocoleae]
MSIRKFRSFARRLQVKPQTTSNMPGNRFEHGMVTAEYALGTVATTGIAGIIIWLSQQEWLRDLIANIFKQLLSSFL